MKNPLIDKDFLYALDQYQHKELYARIIALTFDERPLETIEGRVTSGSINIDGNSAVRRTCNLTLIAKDVNITDFYWGVSNKFILEIGVKNFINSDYPDIIWFKQGIYVISTFNSSLNQSNYTISIGGKDKMCLLNGDIGGSLPASIDFGVMDEIEDVYTKVEFKDFIDYKANQYYICVDTVNDKYELSTDAYDSDNVYYSKDSIIKKIQLPLKDIILNAVHVYGKEQYKNIIINDLDECGLELLQYRGDKDLYLLYDEDASIYDQMTINENYELGERILKVSEDGKSYITDGVKYFIRDAINNLSSLNQGVDINSFTNERWIYKNDLGKRHSLTRISANDEKYNASAIGYRMTDLTYAGDLISSIGEPLTSILDKIKTMLGAFEYFYDVNGNFVFQAKKSYSNKSWNSLVDTDGNIFARDMIEDSPYSYSFEDVNLIQQFTNTPAINTVKNDYSVWGVRKSVTGQEIPIHSRYAIHKKPEYYQNFDGEIYTTFDIEDIVPMPERSLLPECLLPESGAYEGDGEWWNIFDWAELYKALTGDYPTLRMGNYAKSTCKMDLEKYFPGGVSWNVNRPLFLFDVNPDGSLQYIGHNPSRDGMSPAQSCSHTYTYFLDNMAKQNIVSYIYAPEIPTFVKVKYNKVDWREIIYQMAKDYYKHGQEPDFLAKVTANNITDKGDNYYPSGITGYEMFYEDVQGFWRQLYNPNPEKNYKTTGGEYVEAKFYRYINKDNFSMNKSQLYLPDKDKKIFTKLSSSAVYDENKEYYTLNAEIGEKEYRVGYYWSPIEFVIDEISKKQVFTSDYFFKHDGDNVEVNKNNYSNQYFYWHKNVIQAPHLLNFWMDFYNGENSLQQYEIPAIGDRSKVVNDSKITSVYFKSVPQIIFIKDSNIDPAQMKSGYTYIYLTKNMADLFSICSRGKSAEEEVLDLFNKHSYCTETVSITTIPIYHLEPNTIIHIKNDENHLNGKYEVSKLTIPLNANGMMSISATKIIDAI